MKIKKLLIISLLLIFAVNAVNASEDADLLQNPIDNEILGSTYEIDESNYDTYFDSNTGELHNDTVITNGDTLKLGNLTNKTLHINKNLNITRISSNDTLINSKISLVSGSDNSIINNIRMINNENTTFTEEIELNNVNNITIQNSYLKATNDTTYLILANNTKRITLSYITYNTDTGTTAVRFDKSNNTYINNLKDENIIRANDLIKIEKNASKFEAIFSSTLDPYNLKNKTVTFKINGVKYRRTTDENGVARMNINLGPGTYTIQSIHPTTGDIKTNTITVLPRIVENNDLEKYYRNASQYLVKVLDDNGNPVKANETVTFNINGVFYNRTTNNDGIARLNIKLQPGDYIITAEYKKCKVSNNIKVKPVLYAEDLVKKYGELDQFKVKLLDGTGNPLVNTTVTFNINGVFYNRTTNSEGIARLNIKLQSGEYIITSSYNNSNIANKVTVTD